MAIDRLIRAAALLALLGGSAAAKDPSMPMPSRTGNTALFSGELSAGWRRKALAEGGTGYFFTDGRGSIRVERLDKDLKAYEAALKESPPDVEASTVSAAGRTCDLLRRQFQARTGGDESRGRDEWVYEETLLVPDKGGFWELKFRKTSPTRRAEPSAGEAWKNFIKTFRPAKRP